MSAADFALPEDLRPLWSATEDLLVAYDEILDRLDPPRLPEYAQRLSPLIAALNEALAAAGGAPDSETNVDSGGQLLRGANQVLQSAQRLEAAGAGGPHAIMKAFQALRPLSRGRDLLFGLAGRYAPVSRYFLEPTLRDRTELLDRLMIAAGEVPSGETTDAPPRGLMHVDNAFGKRAGYSLCVPEYYTVKRKWPLVVALHGGSGHGADFVWSWLPMARAFGFVLVAPTSRGRTWSLRNPGLDAANLNRILSDVSGTYNIDTSRLLLTGISDGGTYAVLLSVVHQAPFTHYAPVASAVHVLMNREGKIEAPVAGKKYYQVHGGRDWMFPVDRARQVAEALKAAGAEAVYREIEDLSHNYPGDENRHILEWFSPGLEPD